MIACLTLAGCANYPADMLGEPLDKAVSMYGRPVGAVDNQGARKFYFSPDGKSEQKQVRNKELLNPEMPIFKTNYKPDSCIYIFNALWTGARQEWIIHSVNKSPQCGGAS